MSQPWLKIELEYGAVPKHNFLLRLEMILNISTVDNVPQLAMFHLGFKFVWPTPELPSFW
jgi:hypothetical protein